MVGVVLAAAAAADEQILLRVKRVLRCVPALRLQHARAARPGMRTATEGAEATLCRTPRDVGHWFKVESTTFPSQIPARRGLRKSPRLSAGLASRIPAMSLPSSPGGPV
jgi:hypothetical protein